MAQLDNHRGKVKWRIGITQRRVEETPQSFARDALDAAWSAWFAARGLETQFLAIPNFSDPGHAVRYVDAWDINLLLLSGGEDVGTSPRRDAVEVALLAHAQASGMGVVGVCRGMQLLHLHGGGKLLEDETHKGRSHGLARTGAVLQVNSWHRWTVSEPTAGWRVLATAGDGSIEAMRHEHLPWLGLMWHPERDEGQADLVWQWIDDLQRSVARWKATQP